MIKHILSLVVILMALSQSPSAHFGMVIPSTNIVTPQQKNVALTLSFSHPFEGIGMELVKPAQFYLSVSGHQTDLLNTLQQTTTALKRPGETDKDVEQGAVLWIYMNEYRKQ